MIYRRYVKYPLDRVIGLVLAISFSPIFVLLCISLIITQGSPLFFLQKRSGLNKRPFQLIKFRTLVPSTDTSLDISNRKYTMFGNIMRKSGIDELPQLLNIIKGEMSFVGPRPMPVEYDNLYTENHNKRFLIKPGLTGLAQVHGKNDITWRRRFDLDIKYTSSVSPFLDLKICLLTLSQIFSSLTNSGKINREMPVFNGRNLD